MFVKLQAEPRSTFTKSAKSELRKAGRVPAVVYGKKFSGTPITVNEKEVQQILSTRPNTLIELEVQGEFRDTAVIREIQRDSFSRRILSLAFHQVTRNEPVRVSVPLELMVTPEDKELEVQFLHYELEVMCLPDQIPAVLQVDPEPLRQGRALLVEDIQMPEGVKTLLPPEEVVVTILNVAVPQAPVESEEEVTA
ncbi:50S ribosomal protein L25 [Paenibacillus mesotrionivorans]|uniref:50S ribosomal protein L25 n=1 Tax=Paenibacillus mesotrionivorans TaxID=3160968 RepID=A0ACC7NT63_9BACL